MTGAPHRRPKIADLYCAAGGGAMGYHWAGFDVVGFDAKPQPHYPFPFRQVDLTKVDIADLLLSGGFAAAHGSPPCQKFTAYRRRKDHVGEYPNLIPQTREALVNTGLPYVIENVPGAPLRSPIVLCGSSFGLDIRRHRLFESNLPIAGLPCAHEWQTPRFPPATNRTNLRRTVEVGVWRIPLEVQQKAMGIDWMELHELTLAIPPAYTRFLGEQVLRHLAGISAAHDRGVT